MKTFLIIVFIINCFFLISVFSAKKPKAAKQTATTAAPTAQPPPPPAAAEGAPAPTIDWGKCPQLEPKESDKLAKAQVLEACLKANPLPKNLTEESVEKHQKQMAECALKKENWFSKSGSYRFSKAESEIKTKQLAKEIETELIKHHKKCESEAKQQFPQKSAVIDQIQLYQACMDFHITDTCAIQLKQQQ